MEPNLLMVAVGVAFILVSSVLWTLGRKQGNSPVATLGNPEAQHAQQVKRADRQMDEADGRAKRANQQLDQTEAQNRRLDQLLDKWEEQAHCQDDILDHLERQHGLKKQVNEGV